MQDPALLSWGLGFFAALLHGTAYVLYNLQMKKGDVKPNVVSWFIWAFMAGLNFLSFAQVTSFAHALQYAVGTLATIVTFVLALLWGKFDWPSRKEATVLVICLLAVWVWKRTDDPGAANAVFLAAFVVSFYPTFVDIYEDPLKARPFPWIVWTAAFAVNLTNNLLSWDGRWISVVNPIFLGLCHASIAYLSRESRVRRLAVTGR